MKPNGGHHAKEFAEESMCVGGVLGGGSHHCGVSINWVPTKAVDGVTPYELGTIACLMSITSALSGAWHSSRRQGRI
jgi:hypothetical protein